MLESIAKLIKRDVAEQKILRVLIPTNTTLVIPRQSYVLHYCRAWVPHNFLSHQSMISEELLPLFSHFSGQKSWDPWRYLNAASHIQIRPEIWSMLVQNPNNPEDLRQSPHNLSRAYTKFGAGQKKPNPNKHTNPPPPKPTNSTVFCFFRCF